MPIGFEFGVGKFLAVFRSKFLEVIRNVGKPTTETIHVTETISVAAVTLLFIRRQTMRILLGDSFHRTQHV